MACLPERRKVKAAASLSHIRAPVMEAETAKWRAGKTVKGSGAGLHKGDVRVKGIALIECKSTVHASFSVTRKLLDKIEAEAMGLGEIPAMEIEVDNSSSNPVKVFVIPSWAVDLLFARLREAEENRA
jgi:hypothetical protein